MSKRRNPPWSDLPQELLSTISNFLPSNSIDILTFRSVCKSWYSSSPPVYPFILSIFLPVTCQYPPCSFDIRFDIHNLGNPIISVTAIFAIRQHSLDQIRHIMFADQLTPSKFFIREPLSNRHYATPFNFPAYIDVPNVHVTEIGRFYNLNFHSGINKPPSVWNEHLLKVLVSSDETEAVALYHTGQLVVSTIKTFPYGEGGQWLPLYTCRDDNLDARIDDVVYYKGKILGVNHRCILYNMVSERRSKVIAAGIYGCGGKRKRLVESNGRLYLVVRDMFNVREENVEVVEFTVFEFNEVDKKWVEVTSVGGRVFFFGLNFSFSVSSQESGGSFGKDCVVFQEGSFEHYHGSAVVGAGANDDNNGNGDRDGDGETDGDVDVDGDDDDESDDDGDDDNDDESDGDRDEVGANDDETAVDHDSDDESDGDWNEAGEEDGANDDDTVVDHDSDVNGDGDEDGTNDDDDTVVDHDSDVIGDGDEVGEEDGANDGLAAVVDHDSDVNDDENEVGEEDGANDDDAAVDHDSDVNVDGDEVGEGDGANDEHTVVNQDSDANGDASDDTLLSPLRCMDLPIGVWHMETPCHIGKIASYPGCSELLWPPPSWLWPIDISKRMVDLEAALDEILVNDPAEKSKAMSNDLDVANHDGDSEIWKRAHIMKKCLYKSKDFHNHLERVKANDVSRQKFFEPLILPNQAGSSYSGTEEGQQSVVNTIQNASEHSETRATSLSDGIKIDRVIFHLEEIMTKLQNKFKSLQQPSVDVVE